MTEKPKKPRRQRVDSPAGVAAAIISGGKKITLPAGTTFTATERKVFTELCDEFSKTELTAHKIRLLVMLARDLVAVNREQVLLSREGVVLINSHGNAYPTLATGAAASMAGKGAAGASRAAGSASASYVRRVCALGRDRRNASPVRRGGERRGRATQLPRRRPLHDRRPTI